MQGLNADGRPFRALISARTVRTRAATEAAWMRKSYDSYLVHQNPDSDTAHPEFLDILLALEETVRLLDPYKKGNGMR